MGIERKYKDPDAVKWFGVDWADYLGSDTILTSIWIIPAGLTQAGAGNTDTQASVKIGGGVLNQVYRIANRITTSNGETLDKSIDIEIIEE